MSDSTNIHLYSTQIGTVADHNAQLNEQNSLRAPKEAGYDTNRYIKFDGVGRYLVPKIPEVAEDKDFVIFEVFDEVLQRAVMIKMADPNLCDTSNVLKPDSTAFLAYNEARILANLNHPNILKVHDFTLVNIDGKYVPCSVLEKLHGHGMETTKFTKEGGDGTESIDEVLDQFEDIAGAIDYMHSQGVINGDIKPWHFYIDESKDSEGKTVTRRAVLIDFGTARRVGIDLPIRTLLKQDLVTPGFASPDAVLSLPPRIEDDLWSYTASMYYLLTGKHPYGESDDFETPSTKRRVLDPTLYKEFWIHEKVIKEFGLDVCESVAEIFKEILVNQNFSKYPNAKSILGAMRKILSPNSKYDNSYLAAEEVDSVEKP